MIYNMRRRKKRTFTVTLSGMFHKKENSYNMEAECYVTIDGTIYATTGAYEVSRSSSILIYAQNFSIPTNQTSPGTITLNGKKVNQSEAYELKITGNAVIKGDVRNTGIQRTASAAITMPA